MEKVWLEHYPAGVPERVDVEAYRSLVDVFESSCRRFADRPAFTNRGATLSFRDLESQSRLFAAFLQQELGLAKGDAVALMLPNLLQVPVALFGILRAGLVAVNVDPLSTPRDLIHQLADANARAILVFADFADVVAQTLAQTRLEHIIVTEAGDLLPFPRSWIANRSQRRLQGRSPARCLPHAHRFNDTLATGRRRLFYPLEPAPDDVALIQYTGGTTGLAKGAVLTHRNLVANLQQVSAWVGPVLRDGRETVITVLPLHRIFCLTVNCLSFLKHGGRNVLVTDPSDIPGTIKTMRRWPCTVITGVDSLFDDLLNDRTFARLDFSGLRFCMGGGAAVHKTVAQRWKAVTGVPVLECYGLSEASPIVCINPVDLETDSGRAGLPVPSTDISVRDEAGAETGIGAAGELWVRGPQVMRGYLNRPAETAKVLTDDGWLKTGDIAAVDAAGFVRIVERKKDMIQVSGFDVYPSEIEDVVATCDGVREVACVGVPDERSGEAVKLLVVPHAGRPLSEEAVRRHCHGRLTGYKTPKYVELREALPRSVVGRILRRQLR